MNLNPSDSIDISLFPGLRYLNVEKKAASSPEYLKSLAAHSPSYFDYLADSGKRVFNAQPFGTNYELNFPNDRLTRRFSSKLWRGRVSPRSCRSYTSRNGRLLEQP